MGFYPPDSLVHEAQRSGIEVLPPDVNESGLECDVELAGRAAELAGAPHGRVRIGLGYVRGVRAGEVAELVAARQGNGRFRSLADLASRAGRAHPRSSCWPGQGRATRSPPGVMNAADRRPGSARRVALWQLGVMTPGRRVPGGNPTRATARSHGRPPELRELSAWEAMLADYGTTGLTVRTHPLALLRDRLPADAVSSSELETLDHGRRVRVGGLVVARQRPGTASGGRVHPASRTSSHDQPDRAAEDLRASPV